MIKITKTCVSGWDAAIRGMRNPMNSWDKSDTDLTYSKFQTIEDCIGTNDICLMMNLAEGGPVHAKYRRMINVTADIIAPLYWWKEFDTYKIGTVANSCSTMHTIMKKPFDINDFSMEFCKSLDGVEEVPQIAHELVDTLNKLRDTYMDDPTKDNKILWYQLIQLLPSSYNQLRTVQLNYENLYNMYFYRRHHKLDEWRDFCNWIEDLPLSKQIIRTKFLDV